MGISATAYVDKDNSAEIILYNTIPFTTSAWSIAFSDSDLPFDIEFAYGLKQNGVGVLSDNGRELTIRIPVCPFNEFLLTVGTFKKRFNLTDGDTTWTAQLVAANNVNYISTMHLGGNMGIVRKSFVFFCNKKTPGLKGGSITAQLFQNNKLKGYTIGTIFDSVIDESYISVWPYSGAIFSAFYWLPGQVPTATQEYQMQFSVSERDSGAYKDFNFNISLNDNKTISPTSNIFKVKATHTFRIDGWIQA